MGKCIRNLPRIYRNPTVNTILYGTEPGKTSPNWFIRWIYPDVWSVREVLSPFKSNRYEFSSGSDLVKFVRSKKLTVFSDKWLYTNVY